MPRATVASSLRSSTYGPLQVNNTHRLERCLWYSYIIFDAPLQYQGGSNYMLKKETSKKEKSKPRSNVSAYLVWYSVVLVDTHRAARDRAMSFRTLTIRSCGQ